MSKRKMMDCLQCEKSYFTENPERETELFCSDDCLNVYQDNEENKIIFTYKERINAWNNDFGDENYYNCDRCNKVGKIKDFEWIENICYRCFMKCEIFIWKYQKEGDK